MGIIWTILIGFVVGLLARAVMPGTQTLGFIWTTVLGIGGSLIAGYIGKAMGWYQTVGSAPGLIASVIGALVLLLIYGMVVKKS